MAQDLIFWCRWLRWFWKMPLRIHYGFGPNASENWRIATARWDADEPCRKRKLIKPTKAEDRRINQGIKCDPDTFESTAADFARAKPAKDILPKTLLKEMEKRWPKI